MGKLGSLTNYLTQKNHFEYYLSLFRVFLVILIFNKVFHLWSNKSILLSNSGFYVHSNTVYDFVGLSTTFVLDNSIYLLIALIVTLILLLFGIGKNITALILFLEIYFINSFISPILNGGDNLLIFVLMYFVFTNSYEHFTLNNNSEKKGGSISNFYSNLAVYCILFHLCYVYFITGIHKLHSDVWFNGTATYYILNLERFQSPISHHIKDNGIVSTISTYATVLFEIYFIVLVWVKSLRNIMLILGILLHMGIFIFMMIFDFEIFFISLYGFFLTNDEWRFYIRKLIPNFDKTTVPA